MCVMDHEKSRQNLLFTLENKISNHNFRAQVLNSSKSQLGGWARREGERERGGGGGEEREREKESYNREIEIYSQT